MKLTLLALAAFAGALTAQQVVLPANAHLMENPTQGANTGVTTWWRNGVGHFQVLYEANHFVGKAGVAGPVTISRLRFRGEDGEPNLGGQVYSGVTIELGTTTLTGATLSTTFATNRLPATTTMGPLGTATVTVLPAAGTTPNNWCIDIDLVAIGAMISYDPTGAQPNLLLDITVPSTPTGSAGAQIVPMQDTTGTAATIFGRAIAATTTTATTGTGANPPVIGLEVLGGGGHAAVIPATTERYGAACGGSPSTFYEAFQNGQAFDLTGLTLTPDNSVSPNFYVVTNTAPPVDLTQLNASPNSITDDAVVTHALGFTFAYPGGSTTTIKPCTNGFVWLDSAMTATTYYAEIPALLGSSSNLTARLAACWHDFVPGRNTSTHPNAGLHVKTDTSGGPGNAVSYVTWNGVGTFKTVGGPGHADYTFQCVLHEATGVVEFRYGSMMAHVAHWSTITTNVVHAVVGFTRGRVAGIGSVDPQSRDLSLEGPFATSVEGATGNMGQVAVATPDAGGAVYGGRLFGGQTVTWNVTNVPAGAVFGVQLVDVGATRPGLQLPGITAPGCMLSTTPGALLWEVSVLPGATVTGTVPLVVPHGVEGTEIFAQYVVLDLTGGPNLISAASNALKHTIGLD